MACRFVSKSEKFLTCKKYGSDAKVIHITKAALNYKKNNKAT